MAASPERTCVGCRRVATPGELVRVVRAPDGRVAVGPGPGRGAWLCAGSADCLERALRRGALAAALRHPALTSAEIDDLRARLCG